MPTESASNPVTNKEIDRAQNYWETNPEAALATTWTSAPIVQGIVNERMTGGETNHYWLLWLIKDFFGGKQCDRLLSIGCGVGNHEIFMAELGFAKHIDAFDLSETSIEIAKKNAEAAGVNINFYQDNFNTFSINLNLKYDIIFCSGSLHHVTELERCLLNIRNNLKVNGYLVVNEYVGECYTVYEEKQVDLINRLYQCFDPSLRRNPETEEFINRTVEQVWSADPSEGVRSKLIMPFLKHYFYPEVCNHYGGGIMSELYPLIDATQFLPGDSKGETIINLLMEFEEILMEIPGGLPSDFCFSIWRQQRLTKKLPGPDFLIIGAQKCGTNSLYYYLSQHPSIAAATQKEVHYFDLNFDRELYWYQSHFPEASPGILTGEASPYYIFHPLVAERVFDLYPQMKLIVLLRNPVERTISHYYWEVKLGCESLSLSEALSAESSRLEGKVEKILLDGNYYSFNHQHYTYLSRSVYVEQLEQWMSIFPREQFLILKSEDLFKNPAATMNEVFEFLDLPPHESDEYIPYNLGDYPPVNEEIYQELAEYFRPHNRRLSELLGKDFYWK